MEKVSRQSRKISGSGLSSRTSPDSRIPRNHCRKSNLLRAIGKVSADQLLSANNGTPRVRNSASRSTVPAIGPASISSYRSNQASISAAWPGCSNFREAQASANDRPASCCKFQDGVQTFARKCSIAASSPWKSLRYKWRGFQSISTPPRSNTATKRSAIVVVPIESKLLTVALLSRSFSARARTFLSPALPAPDSVRDSESPVLHSKHADSAAPRSSCISLQEYGSRMPPKG